MQVVIMNKAGVAVELLVRTEMAKPDQMRLILLVVMVEMEIVAQEDLEEQIVAETMVILGNRTS